MALRRPFIAGAGTAGLLVAFAALLLVVAGALIGFRAWPGGGSVGDAGSIALHDAKLTGLKAPTLASVAAPADAAAKAAAGGRRHASAAGRKRHARDAQGVAGVRRTSGQDQAPGSGASAGAAGGSPAAPAAPVTAPGGNLMKDASDQVANTVHQVTQTAGGQLGGTSNPVGKVVVDTGNAVSKTVQDLGVRAGVKPKLP
jgi:hypothetical protein